jgi:hypothetical protein
MSLAPNFTLLSSLVQIERRDFDLAVPDLLNPLNANPLLDGEWLALNSSYQLIRGVGAATRPTWPVFAERGRYDTQAIGKTTVLFGGFYEAETSIANLAGLAVGDLLEVGDVTIGGLVKKGLLEAAGAGQHWIVGVVTRLPGGGKVRFWHNGGFQVTI